MKDTAKAFLHFAIAFAVIFTSAFAGTAVTFNGSSFSIPSAGETNWSSLSNFLISVANNAQTINKQVGAIRIATSSPVTVAVTDYAVITNLTVAGAVSVTLPAGVTGQRFIVSDGKGDAVTNNITITSVTGQLINGGASHVINENYGGVSLQFDGTRWRIVEDAVSENPKFSTLTATGASVLAGLTATTGVFSSTLGVTGASTLAALSATTGSFSSTLGVTGTSTLGTVNAGAGSFSTLASSGLSTLNSLSVTNNASVGGSLSIAGAFAPNSLAVATSATIGSTLGVSGTASFNDSVAIAGAITNAGVEVPTISSTSTLTNKSLVDTSTFVIHTTDAAKRAVFDVGSVASGATRTWSFPNADGTFAGTTNTQTLTNKTLGSTNTLTGATASSFTNVGTISLPSSTSTLATLALSETLTNKTLTSPVISGGTINNASVGATSASTGAFTTLASSGVATLGTASGTDRHFVNGSLSIRSNASADGISFSGYSGSIPAAGTYDFTVVPAGNFTGFVTVTSASSSGGNVITSRVYFVSHLAITTSTYTQLGVDHNGTGGGSSFTIARSSNNTIRVTNTSGVNASFYLTFHGHIAPT